MGLMVLITLMALATAHALPAGQQQQQQPSLSAELIAPLIPNSTQSGGTPQQQQQGWTQQQQQGLQLRHFISTQQELDAAIAVRPAVVLFTTDSNCWRCAKANEVFALSAEVLAHEGFLHFVVDPGVHPEIGAAYHVGGTEVGEVHLQGKESAPARPLPLIEYYWGSVSTLEGAQSTQTYDQLWETLEARVRACGEPAKFMRASEAAEHLTDFTRLAHHHAAKQHKAFEPAPARNSSVPSGLWWQALGPGELAPRWVGAPDLFPTRGRELVNDKLSSALRTKAYDHNPQALEFTAGELSSFGLTGELQFDDYIRAVDGKYYKPRRMPTIALPESLAVQATAAGAPPKQEIRLDLAACGRDAVIPNDAK